MDEATAVKISRDIWGNADRDDGDSAEAALEEDASDAGSAREQEARTEPSVPSDNVVGLPKAQSANARLAAAQKALKGGNESAQLRSAVPPDEEILLEAYASIWIPKDASQHVRAQLNSMMDQVQQLDPQIEINRP